MALKTWIGANGGSWATTGNWSGGTPTLNDDVVFSSNGSGAAIGATANCKSLTITGSNVTITGASALNIYGNITVNSTTSISATGTWSILNTAGQTTYDIVSAGRTFNCSLVLNAGASSSYRLIKAASSANGDFTMAAARTLTLTSGTLNLNGYFLTVGLFSSSNSNTRGITFSSDHSNYIALTGVGTVFSQTTSTGWSYTGYSDFTVSDASATGKIVTTTGMSTYPANFYFTGAGTVTLTSGNYFLNLDAGVFTGTLSKASGSTMNIGASVLLGSSMTSGIGGSGATTFSLVSGLGGSLATGTLDLAGKNWSPMTFSSGAWETTGYVGTSAATNAVICSGGSLNILWDFYCFTFTVSGCTVTLDALLICNQTSSSTTAFAVSSGVFVMTYFGGVTCNVATISGGRMAIDAFGYAIDCLRMNFTAGTCYWQGIDSFSTIRYDIYSLGGVHIKHRSVVSNWSSGANQQRYDSSSVNIVVMFTTYNTASGTLRNITDTSGMFAFCWDTHITNIQRFGIAPNSVIGGIDTNRIDPSTFEGGYSFTCNGSYSDSIPTFRTQGGTITFRGGTSSLPNYFFPTGGDFPWAVTFGSNSYFRLPQGAYCYGIRTDVSFAFTMSGCTIESTGSSSMYFNVINLNQAGTNIIICSDTQVVQFNATYTGSASVIVARGTGLTFQGVSSPSLILYGQGSGAQSTVYLPSESNYSLSTTTYRACSFSDSYGSSGAVYINPDSSMGTTYLYTITLTGQYATCVYSNITVQSHATITTTQSADFYRSLIILGILNYNQQSTFSKGVNNFISGGIFIGNSTINSTAVTLRFYDDYQGATVTINSGQVTFPPSLTRYILPDLVVNSINASSATTLALLNGITYDEDGSSTTYRPYIRNLTLAATGTINFTAGTVLESDPLNFSSTRTWELGGRTIEPTVIVSPNSRLNITDTANLATTYIKNLISSTSLATVFSSTIGFSSTSGSGIFTHSYSSATQTLTFSLNGDTLDGIVMDLLYNITIPTGKSVAYSINYSISSEANFDFGSITISGATAVSGVSGSSSGTVSGSTSTSGQIRIRYSKDGSSTGGSDTFSGTIVFSNAGELPSTLRFQAGRTFTFDKFFHDPTVYALTLASTTSGTQTNLAIATRNLGTIVQGTNPGGVFTATITDCAVTSGEYIWYAGKYYVNGGNNSGWIFAESPTQLSTQFLL